MIAAGEPSAAPKSSPNAAAPEVPVVEAAAPAASPVGIATTTAEPAVPGTAEAVPHAGNLAAAAATASATHQDTPAAPPKAPVAGQPTPAAAGGGAFPGANRLMFKICVIWGLERASEGVCASEGFGSRV